MTARITISGSIPDRSPEYNEAEFLQAGCPPCSQTTVVKAPKG